MKQRCARLIIGGTGSGCGKTTVTCALMQALVNRKQKVGAFKCGPDYIDPMFHSRIIGTKSRNLDLFFFGENTARAVLAKNSQDRDISILEGVMGFYDGLSLTGTRASTYEVARVTDSPVILVVNGKGASLSILASLQGFLDFLPENHISGVILNQCSQSTYQELKPEIEKRFSGRVLPLGFFPKLPGCTLESRHLGLVTADEIADLKEKMGMLAAQAEKSLDMEKILRLAQAAPDISYDPISVPHFPESVRIAAAKDKAFCFYYEDSLDVLREMGAEIVPFSPLADGALPENIQGLYFGGGYPELYAGILSENRSMRSAVLAALNREVPCIAECGGFMYLTESIDGYPMVGYLKGKCLDTGKLTRFGYVTLRARKDNLLCKAGDTIPAHEFHHWDCEDTGASFVAEKSSGKTWDCVVSGETLYAGYPHFHFLSNLAFASSFYKRCLREKHRYDGIL